MGVKVRAIKKGYFNFMLREPGMPGEIFEIQDNGDFSSKWMEKIGEKSVRDGHAEEHEEKKAQVKTGRASDRSPI